MSFRLLGTTRARLLRSTATAISTSASPSAVSSSSSSSSSSTTAAAAAGLAVGSSKCVGCRSSSVLAGEQARSRGEIGIGIGSIAATLVLLGAASSASLNLLSSSSSSSSSSAGEDKERTDDNEAETKAANIFFGKQQQQSFNSSDSHNYIFFPRLSLLKNWMHMTSSYVDASTTMCEAPTKSNNINDGDEEIKDSNKERRHQQQRNNSNNNKINNIRNKNRRRMTNVGRFSLVSETARNPSVPVLVLAMTGKPLKSDDFRRLYQQKKVSEKHPRFAARLDSTKTHFVFDNGDDDDRETNDNNEIVYYGGRASVVKKDNVRELLFPAIPIAELKDRINDAALYEPLDLNIRLWEAWTATGGSIGQSGAITSQQKGEVEAKVHDENDVESLLLFRAHHCMADGVSLGALFGDLMDEGPEFQEKIERQIKILKQKKEKTPWWKKLLFGLYYWIWGTIKALMYQVYLFSISWYEGWMSPHDDPWVVLQTMYDEKQQQKRSQQQQQQQQQHPPRSLSWATVAPVDEVKKVADFYSRQQLQQENGGGSKKRSSRITINDVFCSCVSAAIIKQLKYHRSVNPELASSSSNSNSKKQLSLPYMNLIMPVHLQGGILLPGQSMGNKIGAMVSRIPGENLGHDDDDVNDNEHNDPALLAQERLIQVHRILNERKQTPAAVLSYLAAGIMGRISPSSASASASGNNNVDDDDTSSSAYSVGSSSSSWTPWLFRKAHANASVVVTNVRGPESCVHLEGRSIRAFLGFLPLPAGVPIGLVVGSYNNEITLTVTAEEYAVPDADKFLGWVQEEYELLKRRSSSSSV